MCCVWKDPGSSLLPSSWPLVSAARCGPTRAALACGVWRAQVAPELYPYGSRGPVGAHYLAAKYNVRWGDVAGADDE